MIRLLAPGDLGSLPADKQMDVPMKTETGPPMWFEVANYSPYAFEIQDDKGTVRGIAGAGDYTSVPLSPITAQMTLHAIATVTTPVPSASYAVYAGITRNPPSHSAAWPLLAGAGSGSGGGGQLVQQFLESTANINAGITFNGASHDTGNNAGAAGAGYSRFRAFAFLDQASTINMQQSRDNATWRTTLSQSAAANSGYVVESIVTLRFVRATLTNTGGGATTVVEFDTELVAI